MTLKIPKTDDERTEMNLLIARALWPEHQWWRDTLPGVWADEDLVFDFVNDLNDCHEAAHRLLELCLKAYAVYVVECRLFNETRSPSCIDAPSEVRAAALAAACEMLKRGVG